MFPPITKKGYHADISQLKIQSKTLNGQMDSQPRDGPP